MKKKASRKIAKQNKEGLIRQLQKEIESLKAQLLLKDTAVTTLQKAIEEALNKHHAEQVDHPTDSLIRGMYR